MESGLFGLPRKVSVWNTEPLMLNAPPPLTTTRGMLSLGDGVFDGVTGTKFAGSVNGTIIAVNNTSSFSGDFINYQNTGGVRFQISASGRIFTSNPPNANTGTAILNLGSTSSSFATSGTGSFAGSSGGTVLAINFANTFVGSMIDVQLMSVGGVNTSANVLYRLDYLGTGYYIQPTQGNTAFGLLNLGSAPFDGSSSGFFTGNSAGTHLAINAASGFTGDLARFQLAGVSKWRVDSTGTVVQSGAITVTSAFLSGTPAGANNPFLQIGTGFAGGGGTNFTGSSSGNYFGINNQAGTFAGNFIDLQLAGVSKFSVDSTGQLFGGTLHTSILSLNMPGTIQGNSTSTNQPSPITINSRQFNASNLVQVAITLLADASTQTSTAGWTGFLVNITDGPGSGTKLLTDLQVSGVSKFNVDSKGTLNDACGQGPAARLEAYKRYS